MMVEGANPATDKRQSSRGKIFPYGDRHGDGMVQVSFSLELPDGPEAEEAGRQVMKLMGLTDPQIVASEPLGPSFTFFVGYGKLLRPVDLDNLKVAKLPWEKLDPGAINKMVRERLGRPIIVVGAATGTDAHTIGLDAILNYKGYAGDHGLEAYSAFRVVNMGSQVENRDLVAKARELRADAVLVSQVVTQRNVHISNLTALVELLEAEGLRDDVVLVCGGPRLNHALAVELGYDAGFGPGTKPSEVASYLVQEVLKRKGV